MRNNQLDGLRGLCAAIVVMYHLISVPQGFSDTLIKWIFPRIFLAGASAVLVFFSLSGFVLYLAYTGADKFQPLPFVARRIGRLYPPVFAATGLSVILFNLCTVRSIEGVTPWFLSLWDTRISPSEMVRHALLIDGDYSFDSPLWSLGVEIQFSMLFPLVVAAIIRFPRASASMSIVISMIGAAAAGRLNLPRALDLFDTLQYSALFVFGALLAKNRTILSERIARFPKLRLLTLIVAVGLAMVQPEIALGAPSMTGAIALTGLVAFSPNWSIVLDSPPIQFLGRISFSLYLTHLPIILAMVYLLSKTLPIAAILVLALPTCLAVAYLTFVLVERPSIVFGRSLANLLRAKTHQVRLGDGHLNMPNDS